MDIIKLLPKNVANQIAAGEVIQRPASAAKEMLENSLDSGADNIQLYVKDAGKTLIQVVDNGCGMSPKDSIRCFERHATSKIKKADDLFAIKSMGFRGEAMASLSSISHIDLKSKQVNNELGTYVNVKGGEIIKHNDCSCLNGTSISIKNLFYNVPARRNFLKSDKIETKHLINQFTRIALANPKIKMSLHLNNIEHFHFEKSNIRQRIVNVIGAKSNQKLVPIEEKTSVVNLNGFIGKPEFCKKTRGEQYFFVNNRFIKSPYLHHAVMNAFKDLIPENYFPSYFLYLEINPRLIDINIHPTKKEIKFEDEKAIYAIIRSAVKYSLGKYNVAPTIDFNQEVSFNITEKEKNKIYKNPQIRVDTNFNPFNIKKSNNTILIDNIIEDTLAKQQKLDIEWDLDFEKETFIQFANQFIICNGKDRLIMIHQQRAHERILYEYYLNKIDVKSQQLVFKEKLSFSISDYTIIQQIKKDIECIGFYYNNIDNNEIEVYAIPNKFEIKNLQKTFEEFIEQEKEETDIKTNIESRCARILAKNMAIKTGKKLVQEEMRLITTNLFKCKKPTNCPNGETVLMNIELSDILKQF